MLKEKFLRIFGAKTEKAESAGKRQKNGGVTEKNKFNFRLINADKIAAENGIEYISKVAKEKYDSNESFANQFYAEKGCYILLYPANDGMPTCPFEWYGKFNGKTKMLMDNQSSFKNITNLSDIILQMVRLYSKYIDEDVIIDSYGFALKLEDKVTPDYVGRASLVMTNRAIKNQRIIPSEFKEAKKFFLNEFLDHFIGWNFGTPVRNNPQLEKELQELNELAIRKKLRKDAGPGFDVWFSSDVEHYELKKA